MRWRLLFAIQLFAATAYAGAKLMTIQNREAQLRTAPNYFSKVVATLSYTERVEVLESQTSWTKVRHPASGREGWIGSSALTTRKLALKATGEDADTGVSSEEQALAGKGFNPQVEAEFKTRNKDVDYASVDKMEAIKIPVEAVQRFLAAGGVTARKGGAQ
jgi:SH3-like domain-containing protein